MPQVHLIEIDAWDMAEEAVRTLRFTDTDDRRVTTLNDKQWIALGSRVRTTISIVNIDGGDSGAGLGPSAGRVSVSALSLVLDDATWANMNALVLKGRPVRIRRGKFGAAYGDFSLIYSGDIERFGWTRDGAGGRVAMNITLSALGGFLDRPLLTETYAGSGGKEGASPLAGQYKPAVFGTAKNIGLVLVDQVNQIYQVHGYGAIAGVDGVFQRGVAMTAMAGDSASYAALVSATVDAGKYKTCLAEGLIRLGSEPADPVTADVRGDAVGGFHQTMPAIIKRMAAIAGLAGAIIDDANFTAFASAHPAEISWVEAGATSLADIIAQILSPHFAYWTVSGAGQLQLGAIRDTATPVVLQNALLALSQPESQPPVLRSRRLGYEPVWRVQGPGEYNVPVTDADWDSITGDGKPSDYADVTAEKQFYKAESGYWNFGGHEGVDPDWDPVNASVEMFSNHIRVTRLPEFPDGTAPCGIDSPDNLTIAASAYPLVQVKVRRAPGSVAATARPRILWKRSGDTTWDYVNRVQVETSRPTVTDTDWTTYVIDLSGNANWSGTIKQLRFEADSSQNADDFLIDFLAVGRTGLGDAADVEPGSVLGNVYDQYYSWVTSNATTQAEENFGVSVSIANEGLVPGDQISFGCDVKSEAGKRKGGCYLIFQDSGGSSIRAWSTGVIDTGGGWKRVMRGGIVIPDGTVFIRLQLQRQNDGAGVTAGAVQGRRPFLNKGATPQPPLPSRVDVEQNATHGAAWSQVSNDGGKPADGATRNDGLPTTGPITSGYIDTNAVQGSHVQSGAVTDDDSSGSNSTGVSTLTGNIMIFGKSITQNRYSLIQAELRIRHEEAGLAGHEGFWAMLRLRRNSVAYVAEMPIFVTGAYRTFALAWYDHSGGAGAGTNTFQIYLEPLVSTGWDYSVAIARIPQWRINK